MAALWGNGAQPGQFPLEQWFYEMPPCTRWWTAATVVTSVLVQCNILNPLQLFYSFRAVYVKSQVRPFMIRLLAISVESKLTSSSTGG
jgi:Derlin-2/3